MRRETALNEHPIFAELNGGQRQIKIGLPLAERTETIVTDHLASYGAALKQHGAVGKRNIGRWLNNRAENSRQPFRRRERAMLRFRRMGSLQKFAAGHRQVLNHFSQEHTRISRRNFAPRTFGSRIGAPLR